MTVFALDDATIFFGGREYIINVRFHIVSNILLMADDLSKLSVKMVLPTLAHGQTLEVTDSIGGSNLMRINYVRLKIPDVVHNLNDTNPSICEETHDRIISEKPFSYLALMDNVDSLLIRKQEPWYVRTSQSVMEI